MTAGRALLVAFSLFAADQQPAAGAPARVSYRIDVPRSRFVVNTETTGMSSMFGHDHKLEVGDYAGEVNLVPGEPVTASLALSVRADSLRAIEERDDDIAAEIDAALRDHVLETAQVPDHHLQEPRGEGHRARGRDLRRQPRRRGSTCTGSAAR